MHLHPSPNLSDILNGFSFAVLNRGDVPIPVPWGMVLSTHLIVPLKLLTTLLLEGPRGVPMTAEVHSSLGLLGPE